MTPALLPALWLWNRGHDPGRPEPHDAFLPRASRIALAGLGIALLALAAWMFLWPEQVIPHWAWRLTPLTARVVAAMVGMVGASLATIAADRRWSAGRTMIESLTIGAALLLVGVLRAWNNFDPASSLPWLTLAVLVVGLLALIALQRAMASRRHAATRAPADAVAAR